MSTTVSAQPVAHGVGIRSPGRAWVVVALLCVFLIINFADKVIVGLAGADLMADMQISAKQFGVVQSSFFWCFAAGAIGGGFLIGRVRAKYLLAGVAILWALSLMPMIWSESYAVLIASRMFLGFVEGPATAMAMSVAHTWFTAERRTIPTSVVGAGAGLGPVIAAPLLTYVIVNHSWHAAFAAMAIVGLLWVPLWLYWGSEGDEIVRPATDPASTDLLLSPNAKTSWNHILRNRSIWGIALFMFSAYAGTAVNVSWLPLYLRTGLGYDKESIGNLVALPFAVTSILMIASGYVSHVMTKRGVTKRLSRGVLPTTMLVLAGVSTIGFALLERGMPNLLLIVVGASLAGAGGGIILTAVSDVVPTYRRGPVLGLIVAVYSMSGVIAPIALGYMVSGATSPAAGYRQGFVALGIVMIIGALVSMMLIHPDRDSLLPKKVGSHDTPEPFTEGSHRSH